jgi:membrane fusion protein, heavy metal efflux system
MKAPFALAAVLMMGALVAGCHSSAAAPPAAETATAAPDGGPLELIVDDAALRSITIEPLSERPVSRTLQVAGKVQFDEDRLVHVRAPLAGQVVDLRVKVGDTVQKGQTLCAINSREAASAIGEHVESHKDLELAEKTAAMTEDLFSHQAASKIALQQAQSDLAKARSRVGRSEQALRLLGLLSEADIDRFDGHVPVISPIRGVVIERRVTDSEYVQSDGMPLMDVADPSTVWVIGEIFERDLHLVAPGAAATVTTTAYPGEQFAGRVNYVSDVIDPTTRTAKIRVAVSNPRSRLKAEMFSSIALDVGDSRPMLAVPPRSVFVEGDKSWVYVATAPRHFVRRAVDALRAGDRVVVDGALLLREEEAKRAS